MPTVFTAGAKASGTGAEGAIASICCGSSSELFTPTAAGGTGPSDGFAIELVVSTEDRAAKMSSTLAPVDEQPVKARQAKRIADLAEKRMGTCTQNKNQTGGRPALPDPTRIANEKLPRKLESHS